MMKTMDVMAEVLLWALVLGACLVVWYMIYVIGLSLFSLLWDVVEGW